MKKFEKTAKILIFVSMLTAGTFYLIITILGYIKNQKITVLHLVIAVMFLVFAIIYKFQKGI